MNITGTNAFGAGGAVIGRADMNTHDVAIAFTALCARGAFEDAGAQFWAEDVVSLEPMEGDMARLTGRAAVTGKSDWWYANHTVHRADVEGPFVHGDQFAVLFDIDVTPKDGDRVQMREIGLYTVRDGRIAEERFFFAAT